MRLLHTRAASAAASLGAGLLLGLAGPVFEKWNNPACDAMSNVFSSGWPWACYAFLVGYFGRTKRESALLSSLGLAIGVFTYYLFKDMSPVIPDGTEPVSVSGGLDSGASSEGLSSQILTWGIAAFTLGAPIGLLGNLARIPDFGGLAFRLVVPLVAFCETSVRISTEVGGKSSVVGTTWNVTRFVAGAVALALVTHTVWSWWRGRCTHTRSDGDVLTYDKSPLPRRK